MEIRELKARDTFAISRILRKLDLRQLVGFFTRKEQDAEQVGLELVGLFIERLADMEDEVLTFLGDLCGKTKDEFADLPLGDMKDVLLQLAAAPEVASFFASIKQAKS
jgi:hypothetical protein